MAFQVAQWMPLFRTRSVQKVATGIRGIRYRSAVNALEETGFWVLREAVHVVMTNGRRILTIPRHDPVHAIAMEGIVRDAGLTVEQFRQLL